MDPKHAQRILAISETPITILPVTSALLAGLGHDPNTNTLAVEFIETSKKPPSVYHYADVSPETFEELRTSPSIGGYFTRNIKNDPHTYPYKRISPPLTEAEREELTAIAATQTEPQAA